MEQHTEISHIPNSLAERSRLRQLLASHVDHHRLIPPLTQQQLEAHVRSIQQAHALPVVFTHWMLVELNNAIWEPLIAGVPMENRLLMLPKCLSNSKKCLATFDEMGLLCQRCSSCSIQDLQDEADQTGMLSMVAEGFSSIIPLIEKKVVEVIIGVGCLDSLEKAFPLILKHGIPAIAIPLNVDGCADTDVDTTYVQSMMRMQSAQIRVPLDYESIKDEVDGWFSQAQLASVFKEVDAAISAPAIHFISRDGKRWRPFLMVATYLALTESSQIPDVVKKTAIAIECFHKASLIHDDIQDNDPIRNGFQTLHTAQGTDVAINLGDLLLGVGYGLLASTGNMKLVQIASKAHVQLCTGQGLELNWSSNPKPMDLSSVISLFEWKTVPAFEVALTMAFECAGQTDTVLYHQLVTYAHEMGVAYQLHDDWEDFQHAEPVEMRPSAVMALIMAQLNDVEKAQAILTSPDLKTCLTSSAYADLLDAALQEVNNLVERQKRKVYEIIHDVRPFEMKRFLFLMTQKILKGLPTTHEQV